MTCFSSLFHGTTAVPISYWEACFFAPCETNCFSCICSMHTFVPKCCWLVLKSCVSYSLGLIFLLLHTTVCLSIQNKRQHQLKSCQNQILITVARCWWFGIVSPLAVAEIRFSITSCTCPDTSEHILVFRK